MNKITKVPDISKIFKNSKCRLCKSEAPEHKDDCLGIIVSSSKIKLTAFRDDYYSPNQIRKYRRTLITLDKDTVENQTKLADKLVGVYVMDMKQFPPEDYSYEGGFEVSIASNVLLNEFVNSKEVLESVKMIDKEIWAKERNKKIIAEARAKFEKKMLSLDKIKEDLKEEVYEAKFKKITDEYNLVIDRESSNKE